MPESTDTGHTEVVEDIPGQLRPVPVRCHFSMANTVESPCFWMIVGALATLTALYMLNRRKL